MEVTDERPGPMLNAADGRNQDFGKFASVSPMRDRVPRRTDAVARVLSRFSKAGESFFQSPGELEAP